MSVDYLRISVTDRCNLRCVYCNPLGDGGFVAPEEILSYEEIRRLVRLFVERGIRKVRLTGGEPLVRKDIAHLARNLSSIDGIEDLAMTTNGVLLEKAAAKLKAAGLNRVNISIDSVDREGYRRITGKDLLDDVLRGIDKAISVGLAPVKINAYFPTDRNTRPAGEYIAGHRIRDTIENHFGPLVSLVGGKSTGPAVYARPAQSRGIIGFINGRSSVFCDSCNRLRLTSDGKIKPCLYSAYSYDMKKLLRSGAVIESKHFYTKANSFMEEFSMRNVGG